MENFSIKKHNIVHNKSAIVLVCQLLQYSLAELWQVTGNSRGDQVSIYDNWCIFIATSVSGGVMSFY